LEEKRINKELANIRKNFRKTDLDGYNKKKYVWKLLYVHLLGYDVEFGHMEAVNLVTSSTYSEKAVGYVAISLLLNENDEVLRLIINSVRNDILGSSENAQCLALTAIANVGGVEFAGTLANEVSKLLTARDCRPVVRKKAALCLLRLFRRTPEIVQAEEWAEKLVRLLDDRNTGVVMCVLSLLTGICQESTEGYEECVPRCVRLLTKVVMNRDYAQDYVYANVPCPWMQVKALQLLQMFPAPEDKSTKNRLADVLTRILGDTHPVKNINRNNTMHAILFESIRLIIELNFDQELLPQAAGLLGRFVSMKDSNMKYLGLEAMSSLAKLPNGNDYIRKHQNTITFLLGDADISIRRRALDLAYEMCDESNVQKLVEQLLEHLAKSDHQIREELVLKISILSANYASNKEYIDYVLRLIAMAGEFVSDGIWHNVVRVVASHPDLHEHAADTVREAVRSPRAHETMVKIASVILGEYGHLIHHQDGSSALEQCEVLFSKFATSDSHTRCLIFSALCKLATVTPEVKEDVLEIATGLKRNVDSDLQQRAVEFCVLAEELSDDLFKDVYSASLDLEPEGGSPTGDGALDDIDVGGGDDEEDEEDDDDDDDMEDLLAGSTGGGKPTADVRPADDLEDLMSGMTAPSTSTAAPVDDLSDLLGGDAPPAVSAAAPLETPAVLKAFATACRSPKGVLYEDDKIQIGWLEQQAYADRQGLCSFFFANRQPGPLTDFTVSISPTQLNIQLQDMAGTIPAGGNAKMGVQVRLEEPYPEAPVATISFKLPNNTSVQYGLRIPVVVTKFCKGYSCNNIQQFGNLWSQGAQTESQVTFTTSRPLERASLEGLFTSLNCTNMASMDPNPANIAAGLQTTTASGQQWCLLRLECAATKTQFRLTTRAMSKEYAEGVMKVIQTQMNSV
jgi:AP-2 complex subunit alpha